MKKVLLAMFLTGQLVAIVSLAYSQNAFSQATPKKIQFAKLSDYVDDWDKRRDGELLAVTDVPPLGKLTYEKSYQMYYFQPDENGGVANTFYTSPALAKILRQYLKKGAYTERIYCTLIQFAGSSDVYRSPFATKIAGFDENGKLSWTATGPPPVKLKIRQ